MIARTNDNQLMFVNARGHRKMESDQSRQRYERQISRFLAENGETAEDLGHESLQNEVEFSRRFRQTGILLGVTFLSMASTLGMVGNIIEPAILSTVMSS